jgi:hypothetical protein
MSLCHALRILAAVLALGILEQPRGETIRLGPWGFGTFLIVRD